MKGKFSLQTDYNIKTGKNQQKFLNIIQSFWDNKNVIQNQQKTGGMFQWQRTWIMNTKIAAIRWAITARTAMEMRIPKIKPAIPTAETTRPLTKEIRATAPDISSDC